MAALVPYLAYLFAILPALALNAALNGLAIFTIPAIGTPYSTMVLVNCS